MQFEASFRSLKPCGVTIEDSEGQVRFDTEEVFEIYHIKGKLLKNGSLEITNPTVYDAVVKVLVENKWQMQKPLGQNAFLNWKKVEIPAEKTIVVSIKSLNL